jgi:hypothetical protein
VGGLTGVAFLGCLVARSEGAYAAALAGVVVVAGFWLSERFRWARVVGFVLAGLVALAAVGAVVASIAADGDTPLPATIERRGDWWEAAIAMTADSPLFGRGPGSFSIEHSRYRTLEDAMQVGSDITDDPHSVFLSFLTSAGLLGAAGLLAAVVWIVRRGLTLERRNLLGVGFFGGFVAYLVQALISIDTVALRAAMWTCVGGMVASQLQIERAPQGKTAKSKRKRAEPIRRIPAVAGVGLLGLAIAIGGLLFGAADKNLRDATVALSDGNVNEGIAEADAALGFRDEYSYRRNYGNQVGALAVSLAESGNEAPATILLDEARSAFDYVPEFPHANAIADWASILSGAISIDDSAGEESIELYERAVELDPLNPTLRNEAAATAIELERFDEAIVFLENYPALDESAALVGRLALAHANAGNETEAREAIELALSLEPGQPDALEADQILEGP